jgi:2Fe-2S ferredoxin
MTTIHFTDAEGSTRDVDANPGDSVMETAVRNGVPGIVAECGGALSCATCHVFVREDHLEDNSRLSCQIRVEDGMDLHVTTPETQV